MNGQWRYILLIGAGLYVIDTIQRRRRKPRVRIVNTVPGGYSAVTLPPFGIYIKREHACNENLLNHELIHWRQYLERGTVLYYLDYLFGMRKGYDGHHMEVEAREGETDWVKHNYTEAVRTGKARTVYNPDFRK